MQAAAFETERSSAISPAHRPRGATPPVPRAALDWTRCGSIERAGPEGLLSLQGAAGNQAVLGLLAGAQAKLVVGQAGDGFEQEADRVADAVVRGDDAPAMSTRGPARAGGVQRRCAACDSGGGTCDECARETLQRKGGATTAGGDVAPDLGARIDALRGGGIPLPASSRGPFEARLGHDLSRVRLHVGDEAARLNRSLGAAAFTVGGDIFFGSGRFQPDTPAGRHLLAHEVVHTVQQGAASALDGDALRLQRLEHPRIQKMDDNAFETASGVRGGLTATPATLTAASGVQGSTFTALACAGTAESRAARQSAVSAGQAAGRASGIPLGGFFGGVAAAVSSACNVSFKFEKAMVGDYPYAGAGGRAVRGAYVKIVMTPTGICGRCDSLDVSQAILFTAAGSGGAVAPAKPDSAVRETRAGWGSATSPSRGWGVDATATGTTPIPWTSNSGDATHPAVLWDSPGGWTTDRNFGMEFRTCLLCTRSGQPRVPLGCVTWGYFIDSTGAIALRPATPVAGCGAATEFRDAATRWDAITGNTAVNLARP
jgi:hypothetical protein